jgi:glycosyltransferase involved in cell wall biosynthesis
MIIINARFLTQKLTGVQRFAIELCFQMKERLGGDVQFVVPYNIIHTEIAEQLGAVVIGKKRGHLWEQIDLPIYLKAKGSPILICLGNTAPVFYHNKISTLHDIMFIRYPKTFSFEFRMLYRILIPRVLHTSKYIFTVSDFSKKEICDYYNVNPDKVAIIYNAVNGMFHHITDNALGKEKYLITVSSFKENKNFIMAYKAFKLAQKYVEGLKLYIIGDVKTGSFNNMDVLVSQLQQDKDVVLLGRVADDKLIKYYSNAMAFLFPSFYEGFGIPVLEAQACGCPVISSNSSALPEVLGDSAILCNSNKENDFANAIVKIAQDKIMSEYLVRRGYENVKRFSWGRSAEYIRDIIKSYDEY